VIAAEEALYRRLLRPGMVVFDAGANIGELSARFAELVAPSGTVVAFEPGPAFAKLAVLPRKHPSIVVENVALFERSGQVSLNVYETDTWSTLANRIVEESGAAVTPVDRVTVPAVTLDEYCDEKGVERIDLLKIDVEGAELQVLRGGERMFRERRIGSCSFEVGETTFDMGNDPADLVAFLADVGFAVENVVPGDPVLPAGGHAFSMHHAFPTT
jgi:FkbM family methyltransferase